MGAESKVVPLPAGDRRQIVSFGGGGFSGGRCIPSHVTLFRRGPRSSS